MFDWLFRLWSGSHDKVPIEEVIDITADDFRKIASTANFKNKDYVEALIRDYGFSGEPFKFIDNYFRIVGTVMKHK